MPNWCENTVEFDVQTEEHVKQISTICSLLKENKLFETVVPFPVLEEPNWYSWRTNNWGCKWEASEVYISNEDEHGNPIVPKVGETFAISFSTPWSPPIGIYNALHKKGLAFEAYYYEPDCAFVGSFIDGTDTRHPTDRPFSEEVATLLDNFIDVREEENYRAQDIRNEYAKSERQPADLQKAIEELMILHKQFNSEDEAKSFLLQESFDFA